MNFSEESRRIFEDISFSNVSREELLALEEAWMPYMYMMNAIAPFTLPLFSFAFVVGCIFGNLLTVVVVVREKDFKTTFYWCLAVDAVAQLLAYTGNYIRYLHNANLLCPAHFFKPAECPNLLTALACATWPIIQPGGTTLSFYMNILISLERVAGLYFPIKYQQMQLQRGRLVAIALSFVFCLWSATNIVHFFSAIVFQGASGHWFVEMWTSNTFPYPRWVVSYKWFVQEVFFRFLYSLTMVVVTVCGTAVAVKMRQRLHQMPHRIEENQKMWNVCKLMATVVLLTMMFCITRFASDIVFDNYEAFRARLGPESTVADVDHVYRLMFQLTLAILVNHFAQLQYCLNFLCMFLFVKSFRDAAMNRVFIPIATCSRRSTFNNRSVNVQNSTESTCL